MITSLDCSSRHSSKINNKRAGNAQACPPFLCYNLSMSKKILIIGNGAKEYALAKKLSEKHEIYTAPASDALKEFTHTLDIREDSTAELLEFVMENGIDMTIPVSSAALKSNIAEVFNNNNQKIFAPENKASRIIFDKALAKKVLYKLRIHTPKFGIFEKQNMVLDYIRNQKVPFVMKTDSPNSAAVFTSALPAKSLVETSFIEKNNRIIIEDYVYGTPFSFYTITDGYKALPIGSSITYKHALEGDGGQLTSGMGACSPNYKLTLEHEYYLMDNVIYPTLDYLEIEGNPYLGILGVNGVLTNDGKIFVLGWQSFMQDCDAPSVLEVLDEDLFELFDSCVVGSFSDESRLIKSGEKCASTIVLTCKNKENNENVIHGLDSIDDDTKIVFYPNVRKNRYLEYEAETGAVLSLTTSAATANSAVKKMYEEAECITFDSVYYRKDICRT